MKTRSSLKIKDETTQKIVKRKGRRYIISIGNKKPRDKKRQG